MGFKKMENGKHTNEKRVSGAISDESLEQVVGGTSNLFYGLNAVYSDTNEGSDPESRSGWKGGGLKDMNNSMGINRFQT